MKGKIKLLLLVILMSALMYIAFFLVGFLLKYEYIFHIMIFALFIQIIGIAVGYYMD